MEDKAADKGEVPPIDDIHDVKSHVASNLDENLPAEEEIQSLDVSAGNMSIQSQIEEDINTDLGAKAVPITTADDTSNDNDLMTPNDSTNHPVETNIEAPVVGSSSPEEDQLAQPGDAERYLGDGNSSSNIHDGPSSEAIIDSTAAQETAEEEAPQEAVPDASNKTQDLEQQQDTQAAQSSAAPVDSNDVAAVAAGALAAGSLLATPAVVEAAGAPSQKEIQSPQDDKVRDISEGIPSEPSAHDLPHRSPSPTPDAATTVESSKSPSAGSQYGTITSDQQDAPQVVQSNELRERSVASGTESSAKSSKQDVVVKDEVLAKPSAASTTPGKLTILASMALGAYAVFKLANGAWGSRYP